MEEDRQWETLPSLALVKIFCKTTIKDRIQSIPLVCHSWNQASYDPRCWSSMIPDSISPEDAFVKENSPFVLFINPFRPKRASKPHLGVLRLRTLIERSGGGAAITSLYLSPFVNGLNYQPNDDDLLHLIANCCPNLKHISFDGSSRASNNAILELINNCKKLVQVDLSSHAHSGYFTASVIEGLGNSCPDLRGIRLRELKGKKYLYTRAFSFIASKLPRLKLLNLSSSATLNDADLSVIVSGSPELQYLDLTKCPQLSYDFYTIPRAHAQIKEFLYDRETGYADAPKITGFRRMRMNDQQVQEEERPWEKVIKRRRWVIRPLPCYSTKIEVKKKKAEKKKKWCHGSIIIYQSNTSCLQSFFFNGKLFSTVEKPKEKDRWGWESLPCTALLNIFCKSELQDRLQSIPLVCKSWKYVTDDPRCWSSMIPDSISPEDAFIKDKTYYFESYGPKSCVMKLVKKKKNYNFLIGISRLFKEEGDDQVDKEEIYDDEEIYYKEEVSVGLTRLRTLIKKSGGGAAITSLYLSPFILRPDVEENDEMFSLIANCCPNLKHISLDILFYMGSIEPRLQLFNRCKKLELVDLRFIGYEKRGDSTLIIQEIGNCLPNLRGIRIESLEWRDPTAALSIATCLPQLKLLSLWASNHLNGEHLSAILSSCLELQYLYVKVPLRHRHWLYIGPDIVSQDIVDQASAQIPEFYIEDYYSHLCDRRV